MSISKRVVALGIVASLLFVGMASADGVSVGEKAPNFKAKTTEGESITLGDAKGAEAVVVCFTCNKCPVAVAYEDRFIEFNKKYEDKPVKFIALNVNTTESLAEMKQRAEAKHFKFPYAYDASGDSYRAYGARVTPHLYVIDSDGAVAYIGAFDDSMNPQQVSEHYVADAVDALLAGERPETTKTKAFGCSIKR